jgi:2-dehydro-3-deoxyphosphogluconate aldolase / (4S)-4-hydroxy-2-oxoglutarate aldolase
MANQQTEKQDRLAKIMAEAPVIPVVTLDDPRKAVAMARALVAGGLPVIEITLRTPEAFECLRAITDEVEEVIAGAGTVLSPAQIAAAENSGAQFMVSPGYSPKLVEAAENCAVPLLPGTATPSEMMQLGERGYRHLKFFPAMQAGGAAYLKSVMAPLPQFRFCPTGGISADNAVEFLALPNVLCVGGSWVASADKIEASDWTGIEQAAKDARNLLG